MGLVKLDPANRTLLEGVLINYFGSAASTDVGHPDLLEHLMILSDSTPDE